MPFSETEKIMWTDFSSKKEERKEKVQQLSDREIDNRYEEEEQQLLIKINREKLLSLVEYMQEDNYMTIPSWQRNERWDIGDKSKLIESLVMNVPIPPILLYEKDYKSYELIDGQQRIGAIRDFYKNELELKDLEIWPELNGRTYQKLPPKIKDGLNHRSILFVIILLDPDLESNEQLSLKQLAFERLNKGGIALGNQEIRNCLYDGRFNDTLKDLSDHPKFAQAWISSPRKKSDTYKKMEDKELILRFFAFRHIDWYVEQSISGIKDFLDLYMMNSLKFNDKDIKFFRDMFKETLELAHSIYGDQPFKPLWLNETQSKRNLIFYKEYYDAVMVGLSNHLDDRKELIERKNEILKATEELLKKDKAQIFTGQGGNKKDIQERINRFDNMLSQIVKSRV